MLPNYEWALVPQAKITAYLLAFNHEDGRGKARFFMHFGFTVEHWEILAEALLAHAATHMKSPKLNPPHLACAM